MQVSNSNVASRASRLWKLEQNNMTKKGLLLVLRMCECVWENFMKKPSFTKLKRWQHVLHTDSGRQYFDFETFFSLLDTEGCKFSFMKRLSDNAARI